MVPYFRVRRYTWVLPLLSALIKVSPASATNICGAFKFFYNREETGAETPAR